jgi:hypothetical protein
LFVAVEFACQRRRGEAGIGESSVGEDDPAPEQGLERGGGQDEYPRGGLRHRLEVRRVPDGRAYAAAISMARFQPLPGTGHSPQQETPDQVMRAIWDSADTGFSAFAHSPAGPPRPAGRAAVQARPDRP